MPNVAESCESTHTKRAIGRFGSPKKKKLYPDITDALKRKLYPDISDTLKGGRGRKVTFVTP